MKNTNISINITDTRFHVGVIVSVWAIVYPYIAYVGWARPWDEVQFYYPTAKRMVTHGQWLIPHLDEGVPFLEKPPLAMWFQALSMKLFGTTLFAARIPSTVFGLATALLVYHVGRELYDWKIGFTAALVFLATPFVSIHNHSATTADTDIYLLFFGTAFVWLVWQRYDNQRLMIVAGIMGAAAVMVKSFAAGLFLLILLPAVVSNWRQYISRETILGGVVGLMVLLPWPLYAYLTVPDVFLQEMILRETGRAQGSFGSVPMFKMVVGLTGWSDMSSVTGNVGSSGQIAAQLSIPVLFYLAVIGLILLYRRGLFDSKRDLFLAWWIVSVPLFYTIFQGNHDWYLLPIVFPLTILTAAMVRQVVDFINSNFSLISITDTQYVGLAIIAVLIEYGLWVILSDAPETGQVVAGGLLYYPL